MQIERFNREFHQRLPDDVVETVGGLVLDRFGELPHVGALLAIDNLEFKVDSVANNRIEVLFVRQVEPVTAEGATAAGATATPGQGTRAPAGDTHETAADEDQR
jgi:Mg2+/Co2+ transporter CorC